MLPSDMNSFSKPFFFPAVSERGAFSLFISKGTAAISHVLSTRNSKCLPGGLSTYLPLLVVRSMGLLKERASKTCLFSPRTEGAGWEVLLTRTVSEEAIA